MFHIIDDNPMLRELLECIISDASYRSVSFSSGDKYLEYMSTPDFVNPIAVLSDVNMPGINGYDLVLEIRKKFPFQRIILITGNADDEHHVRAASQLCFTLDKPYQPENLITLLNALEACHNNHAKDTQYCGYCRFGIDHHPCPFDSTND